MLLDYRATGELVTPTGISLVKALSSTFGEPPLFRLTHTGVGAGTKEFPNHANIVRVAIGEKIDPIQRQKSFTNAHCSVPTSSSPETQPTEFTQVRNNAGLVLSSPIPAPISVVVDSTSSPSSNAYEIENVIVLETNLDDLNPQVLGYLFERLLAQHALDVWTQPIHMKKNRPGICLQYVCLIASLCGSHSRSCVISVLCFEQHENDIMTIIFQETTTLGMRR